MGYKYWYSDNAMEVTAGGAAGTTITCGGIIQADDGHGGFNVTFGVGTPNKGLYHVHFNGNGSGKRAALPGAVNAVRWKASSSDAGGNNVAVWDKAGKRTNLKSLAYDTNPE